MFGTKDQSMGQSAFVPVITMTMKYMQYIIPSTVYILLHDYNSEISGTEM